MTLYPRGGYQLLEDDMTHFNNPWAELMLEQMWLYQQAAGVASKCIDAELLLDSQALTDHCLEPSMPRLNPLEFHGKRRPGAPAVEAAPPAASGRARYRLLA